MNSKFKKSALGIFFAIPLVLTSSASAASVVKKDDNKPVYETRSSNVNISLADGGGGGYRYGKTIHEYYTSLGSIPTKYYYKEYDTAKQVWMTGYLTRTNVSQISLNKYRVTFSGTLNG